MSLSNFWKQTKNHNSKDVELESCFELYPRTNTVNRISFTPKKQRQWFELRLDNQHEFATRNTNKTNTPFMPKRTSE